jgi:hypothetical protein
MGNLCRGPSIDASSQVSFELAKLFQRKNFLRNRPIRNKHRLWRSCLLTDQNEMRNPYREPSIDASYQVSVHLAKWFQRRRFLEIDQSETRIACGGHCCYWIRTRWTICIEDHPQILPTKFRFIWKSGFRGEVFFYKLTNQKQEMSVEAMFVNGSRRNEQHL